MRFFRLTWGPYRRLLCVEQHTKLNSKEMFRFSLTAFSSLECWLANWNHKMRFSTSTFKALFRAFANCSRRHQHQQSSKSNFLGKKLFTYTQWQPQKAQAACTTVNAVVRSKSERWNRQPTFIRIGQTFWKIKRPEKMVISFQTKYLCKHITDRSCSVKSKFSPRTSEWIAFWVWRIHPCEWNLFWFRFFSLPRRRQHSKCRRRGFAASNSFDGVYLMAKKSISVFLCGGVWTMASRTIIHLSLLSVLRRR